MYFLGYDIGSSSVKVALLSGETGQAVANAQYPKQEMGMIAHEIGWAEQAPEMWWEAIKKATHELLQQADVDKATIAGIGIAYQMHGLVVVDKAQKALRPSIIWCDSRAVEIGDAAFDTLGSDKCLSQLLNSPGNFTASKLKWVKDNEPELFAQIDKIMLPGDYIAMRMSGKAQTTVSGLSEGMFWDFKQEKLADFLMSHYGFDADLIPEIVPTFAPQSELSAFAATELGLPRGIKIAYRAGDQPNNALSLNVLKAGEIAATAGTSGVVYGVSNQVKYDPQSRLNTFAHVNHTAKQTSLGVLLCINGTGILNSWLKHNTGKLDYPDMNALAAEVPVGSDGLVVLPFGNGAERVLGNRNLGSQVLGLSFNNHSKAHLYRAAQEGIVFSLKYGLDVMRGLGMEPKVIRAGKANLFLSPIFRQTLANLCHVKIELYNTDGAEGAARGAAIGLGYYTMNSAFEGLECLEHIEPDLTQQATYEAAYDNWLNALEKAMS